MQIPSTPRTTTLLPQRVLGKMTVAVSYCCCMDGAAANCIGSRKRRSGSDVFHVAVQCMAGRFRH